MKAGSARRRPTPRRCRWVAFDLGGVLYDVDSDRYFDLAARTFGVSRQDIGRATFDADCWQLAECGQLDGAGFLEAVLTRLGVAPGASAAAELRRCWNAMLCLRPGARELLARLTRPAVAWSNTDPVHGAAIAAVLTPDLDWNHSTLSCSIGAEKPQPHFFQQALARLASAPERVCFVDDRPENVAAAAALGIDAYVCSSLAAVRTGLGARGLLAS
ncbi:MAG: HAD-IA family hydrolase [Deltaproteobacteria bacterium]|nr:HAD-IA family hydrolase [Deltaproteobacteria bacterium]